MAELLLIFACFNSSGCEPTASAYRAFNPEPFERVEYLSKQISSTVLVNYWGPFLAYSTGHEGSIVLLKNVSLNLSQSETRLIYKMDF